MKKVDVAIIGAQKAGTTSLNYYLGQHPEILTYENNDIEFKYFANDAAYASGYEKQYLRYFGKTDGGDRKILIKAIGIARSSKVIKRLFDHNPEMNLIYVLRNPVERAYSSYWYARNKGWEDIKTFREAIAAEGTRDHESSNTQYFENGIYWKSLERVFACFKKEQLFVCLHEELRKDSVKVCQEIFSWLNIETTFRPDVSKAQNKRSAVHSVTLSRFLNKKHFLKNAIGWVIPRKYLDSARIIMNRINQTEIVVPPITKDDSAFLRDQYRTHNSKLEDILRIDLSAWK